LSVERSGPSVAGPGPGRGPRGRFAPSPTGPLHFGSLIAAVGSFADARAAGGEWLVRIEDIDRAREVSGAADSILRTLECFGLLWDGPVWYQSRRTEVYAEALARLRGAGLSYGCACSRREIASRGRMGAEGPIYPGTCRRGPPPGRTPRSERLRVVDAPVVVDDRVRGPFTQNLSVEVGDFVLRRADGVHAYQLAVVVDDAEQRIDSVVRGADLLQSTPRQVFLQGLLALPRPSYAHLPVALDADGRKLSKSLASAPVDPADPVPALLQAWSFLGQPPLEEAPGYVEEFWQLAIARWSIERVPRRPASPVRRPETGRG
jgi:glutamyl-Q tRNA(Asp) synthetase